MPPLTANNKGRNGVILIDTQHVRAGGMITESMAHNYATMFPLVIPQHLDDDDLLAIIYHGIWSIN